MSKVTLTISRILSNILCFAGGFFGILILFLIVLSFSLESAKNLIQHLITFSWLFIGAIICAVIIAVGINIKRRICRYKTYVRLISHEKKTFLRDLAKETGKDITYIAKDLQLMIRLHYFSDARIDNKTQEFIITRKLGNVDITALMTEVVTCKDCGADVTKQKNTVAHCEYCGSPIV